jgi:hypothetical protein
MALQQTESELSPLDQVRVRLLQGKTWRYLRYLHLRCGLGLASKVESVLTIGAGNAFAELALALEYPQIEFIVTDVASDQAPSRRACEALVKQWNVGNVRFAAYDALQPPHLEADLVASIEVLEHIEADDVAAANLNRAARRFVFCLVPFSHRERNEDPKVRERVLASHGHFRPGYDHERLAQLFPVPIEIRGCYWADAGIPFRQHLSSLSEEEIARDWRGLAAQAEKDLRTGIPLRARQAGGIWVLARR